MMAGNPNWWNMNIPPPSPPPSSSPPPPHAPLHSTFFQYPHPHHYAFGSSPSHPLGSFAADNNSHELPPQSWSQLLLGGLSGEEAASHKLGPTPSFFQTRKFGSWAEDESILNDESSPGIHVKQEHVSQHGNLYVQHEELPSGHKPVTVWPTARMIPVSSPSSCVTTLSSSNNTVLDFSSNISKGDNGSRNNQNPDRNSSECKSTATGGACKKARVQTSSNPPLKVRKEKLGDRITALHQLVSPFGKTDTASVLLEAIGYIRFLQSQIEALSSPYLGNASGNLNHQHPEIGDNNLPKDLRSRGLCLVPVSCTMQVGNDNGADYWAPAAFGGGF